MKCLKVEDYVKRTASLKDTGLLLEEVKVSMIAICHQPDNSILTLVFVVD